MVAFTLLLEGQLVDFQCSRESLMWRSEEVTKWGKFPGTFHFQLCRCLCFFFRSTLQHCAMVCNVH